METTSSVMATSVSSMCTSETRMLTTTPMAASSTTDGKTPWSHSRRHNGILSWLRSTTSTSPSSTSRPTTSKKTARMKASWLFRTETLCSTARVQRAPMAFGAMQVLKEIPSVHQTTRSSASVPQVQVTSETTLCRWVSNTSNAAMRSSR